MLDRFTAFQKLPRPRGKALHVTLPRPNYLMLCRSEGVSNLIYWLADVTFRPDSHIITSGDGQRVRPDILKRATWPTPAFDPSLPRAGWEIIHPDTQFLLLKGPKSERDLLPLWIFRCQCMWRTPELALDCADEVSCYICSLGAGAVSSGALRTCSVCLLTAHTSCTEIIRSKDRKGDPIAKRSISDLNTLPSSFRASLCCLCSNAFGLHVDD